MSFNRSLNVFDLNLHIVIKAAPNDVPSFDKALTGIETKDLGEDVDMLRDTPLVMEHHLKTGHMKDLVRFNRSLTTPLTKPLDGSPGVILACAKDALEIEDL
jgi:hypothetical protein